MSEFDEWFKSLNEGGRTTYFLGQEGNISKEAWDFQQVKIDELQVKIACMQVKIACMQTRIEKLLDYTGTSGHTPNWIIKEFLK